MTTPTNRFQAKFGCLFLTVRAARGAPAAGVMCTQGVSGMRPVLVGSCWEHFEGGRDWMNARCRNHAFLTNFGRVGARICRCVEWKYLKSKTAPKPPKIDLFNKP